MKKNNLLTKNNIQKKYLNKKITKKLFKNFENVIKEVENNIEEPNKTLNVLKDDLKFNFNPTEGLDTLGIF